MRSNLSVNAHLNFRLKSWFFKCVSSFFEIEQCNINPTTNYLQIYRNVFLFLVFFFIRFIRTHAKQSRVFCLITMSGTQRTFGTLFHLYCISLFHFRFHHLIVPPQYTCAVDIRRFLTLTLLLKSLKSTLIYLNICT